MTTTVAIVGTNSRLKICAAKKAFSELFDNVQVSGVNTPTDVPNQPWDDELYLGAKKRAESAMRETKADYVVGIEAGTVHINGRKMNTACAVIAKQGGIEHIGYSVMFEVPKEILDLVEGGMELSKAVNSCTSRRDSGHGKGLVGILSRGHFDRERMLHEATLMALMGFFNV